MTLGETYQDTAELEPGGIIDFTIPLERAAIVAHRLTFATPDEVAGMLTSPRGQHDLAYTWARLQPADRQLWRRRAAAVRGALDSDADFELVDAPVTP